MPLSGKLFNLPTHWNKYLCLYRDFKKIVLDRFPRWWGDAGDVNVWHCRGFFLSWIFNLYLIFQKWFFTSFRLFSENWKFPRDVVNSNRMISFTKICLPNRFSNFSFTMQVKHAWTFTTICSFLPFIQKIHPFKKILKQFITLQGEFSLFMLSTDMERAQNLVLRSMWNGAKFLTKEAKKERNSNYGSFSAACTADWRW